MADKTPAMVTTRLSLVQQEDGALLGTQVPGLTGNDGSPRRQDLQSYHQEGSWQNQDGLLILISTVTTVSRPDGSVHCPVQLLLEYQTMRMAISRGLPILANKSTVRLGWEKTSGQALTYPTLGFIKDLSSPPRLAIYQT